MRFWKYHALGNDYLVLRPAGPEAPPPEPERIRLLCHRHYGPGSDGILWGPLPSGRARFGLRIFNPDGSEAEKSGNGLRIFARFLADEGLVGTEPFSLDTPGGVVSAAVAEGGRRITVEMGRVRFLSSEVPMAGPVREVLREPLTVLDRTFEVSAATVGNPHCVIFGPEPSEELARRYGPAIETHPAFPARTNVQFAQVIDRSNLRIEIWERGAGYTLASGSSSSAVAAVAHRLSLVDADVTVHMPGGTLAIAIAPDFSIRMTGPTTGVARGELHPDLG